MTLVVLSPTIKDMGDPRELLVSVDAMSRRDTSGAFDAPCLRRTSQLGLVLIAPGLVQLLLGGFAPSGGMVIHSLLCPLAAVLFLGTRSAAGWLLAWLGVMLMTARFEPAGLTPASRLLILVNFSVFGIVACMLIRHALALRDRDAKI